MQQLIKSKSLPQKRLSLSQVTRIVITAITHWLLHVK